jgi:hypothetical protein
MKLMIDGKFFLDIPGATFKNAGDEKTGPLYHWYWYNDDLRGKIEKLLSKKKFQRSSFFEDNNVNLKEQFTRVEIPVNSDPNEIIIHVEYFDGKGKFYDQQFIKSRIKKSIDFLKSISVIGALASIISLIVGIIALYK